MSYLHEQGVGPYLQDALNQIAQLRRKRTPTSKIPTSQLNKDNDHMVAQFLSDYCRSVQQGTHLHKREFSFVILTVRNRLGFVRLVEKAFLPGLIDVDMDGNDLHSLLELLSPDFKLKVSQDAFGLLSPGEKPTMSNLLNCLRFRLLFNEFWEMSFKALTRPTIVMPTGEDPEPGANYFDFETSLTQICSKLRDTNLPSPKIYSIKTHCPTMPKKFQKDGEKIHLYMMTALSHDTKVIELISAFDKF